MGKLGKKARKFAKKHLQSVLRQRRKTKALFKRRSSKGGQNDPEEQEDDNVVERSNGRITKFEDFANISLDAIFIGDSRDEPADMSDSDGYLSEDSDFPSSAASEMEKTFEDEVATSTYSEQNKKIAADLAVKVKKLDKLRKKDPDFNEFLESHNSVDKIQNEDEYSDEDDLSNQEEQGDGLFKGKKLLTRGFIDRLCQMVEEDGNSAALVRLLNAYRAACHYGAESIGHMIESSETFCKIILFTLSNAASIIRNQLHISSSNSTNDTILKLKNSKFKEKPVVKSFVRSTLFLLNQLTDTDILALAMTRIRASLIFFGVFPSLMQRLIKTTVHLWATGERTLSSASYLVIWDIASIFGSDYYEICLSNTLVAFISKSRLTEMADINHMQYLRDCTLELCCLDVEKSSLKAVASITQLAKILSLGLRTKEEAVGRLCSWEYVNCIDLWVMFVSANICDYDDLQPLFFMITKLINGLAYMLPGPRYFPLRLKCIQWLNRLSHSSGKFIPLTSLVLDVLEYKFTEEGRRAQKISNVASVLKLPKHYLKSRSFQEECFHSSVEQLSLHFSQWAYHMSFPDLATATLICLRKIHESTTVESLRRTMRRFLDQVEQNVDFVQKKRDEVSFSPHEHQSVDSFLQFEKCSLNTSFSPYYRSMLEKAAERNLINSGKMSSQKQKILKRKEAEPKNNMVTASPHDNEDQSTDTSSKLLKSKKRTKRQST